MKSYKRYAIHWFRRDLRIAGNPALEWSYKNFEGHVLGFFCFDPAFLSRPDFSANRFQFFLETLKSLKIEMQKMGGDLLVLDHGPKMAFDQLFSFLKSKQLPLPTAVSFNRDYEPFARIRDTQLSELFENQYGLHVHTERDHLLIEPLKIKQKDPKKRFYQVYTPFFNNWFKEFKTKEIQSRILNQKKGVEYLNLKAKGASTTKGFEINWSRLFGKLNTPFEDQLEANLLKNKKNTTIEIPEAGSLVAFKRLTEFKNNILDQYTNTRDIPSVDGTSQLSLYLKNGSLTTSQIIHELKLHELEPHHTTSQMKFLKEIVWREFYYSILYHCPEVEKQSFNPKYRNLKWENNKGLFGAWKEGKTGFPIVDAGMRQLKETGWMHNRVRMIVASFLTKDLLIDWRWGERYFMKTLLDGDLASNNGGWQWAASTGCDAQPYFRVFNPALQSARFDPDGKYIKKYVPELKNTSAASIHNPPAELFTKGYLNPIVDHQTQKQKAILLYKDSK